MLWSAGRGLIESAVNCAPATFDGQDLYNRDEDKIAAMLLLARLNGIHLKYSQSELISLGLGGAEGKIDEAGIMGWLSNYQKG